MIRKKFLKTKGICQVTFELPSSVEAKKAQLVGDFNNWDQSATPLKKVKGIWKTTVELDQNQEYQYRYLVNGSNWHNDDAADKYVSNNVGGDNSVVITAN